MAKNSISEYLPVIQKYVFLFHIILYLTNLFADTPVTTVTSVVTLAVSGLLVLYRLIHIRKYVHYPYFWLYFSFLCAFVISMLVNIQYGWTANAKILIWTTIWFAGLYLFDPDRSEASVDQEMKGSFLLITLENGFFSFISVIMLVIRFLFLRADGKSLFIIGVAKWGRLYGVYTDANYASVICIIGILCAVYLLHVYKKEKKTWLKVLLWIAIVSQYLYLTFSVSRTGMVVLAAVLFLGPIIYMACAGKNVLKGIGTGLLTAVVAIGLEKALILGYNQVSPALDRTFSFLPYSVTNVQGAGTDIEKIGRTKELSGDISNRRFDLWKNAAEVYEQQPVFGVTFGNYNAYERVHMPHCYMLDNDLSVFDAFHNMAMDLLASQGTVGFVLFAVIIFSGLVRVLRNLKTAGRKDPWKYTVLLTGCLGILGSSMFVSEIVYVNNAPTVVFWVFWGYLIFFCGRKTETQKG